MIIPVLEIKRLANATIATTYQSINKYTVEGNLVELEISILPDANATTKGLFKITIGTKSPQDIAIPAPLTIEYLTLYDLTKLLKTIRKEPIEGITPILYVRDPEEWEEMLSAILKKADTVEVLIKSSDGVTAVNADVMIKGRCVT